MSEEFVNCSEVGRNWPETCAPLAVLNSSGRDADQDFPDFAGAPDPAVHAPVNYHGYAAATGGAFLKSVEAVRRRGLKNVLLLLRSDLRASLTALRQLQSQGCRVFVSFKESGLHQVSQTLLKPGNPAFFADLCQMADGAVSSTEDLVAIYQAAGARRLGFIPTPYPVEDPRWDFSIPVTERSGIFVGTREFDVPTRNHALALTSAFSLGESVTVVNDDGRTGRRRIESLAAGRPGVKLQIIEGRCPYPEYLRNMARHRLVWQWDMSAVPGQVAGDALLCGIPCLGGNGATERLVFPGLCGHGRTLPEGMELARRLLADTAFYEAQNQEAKVAALASVSFAVVRERLAAMFAGRGTGVREGGERHGDFLRR